jgi:hypothetical protein
MSKSERTLFQTPELVVWTDGEHITMNAREGRPVWLDSSAGYEAAYRELGRRIEDLKAAQDILMAQVREMTG